MEANILRSGLAEAATSFKSLDLITKSVGLILIPVTRWVYRILNVMFSL